MNYHIPLFKDYSFFTFKHLFLLVCFASIPTICMSQQQKDNALFDLRGNVKECVVTEHHKGLGGTDVYKFNKNGFLYKGLDGTGNIKRENGYIVEYTTFDIYNMFGHDFITKIEYKNGRMIKKISDSEIRIYSYNTEGYCVKEDISSSGKIRTIKYVYLSFDDKGNWLKREKYVDGKQTIEERLISYHGEPMQYIMGFQEVINTIPSQCSILKVINLDDRPDNGDGFYGRDDFKYYYLYKFNLIDIDGNPNDFEYLEYLKCSVNQCTNEKCDTSINERGIVRAVEKIYPSGDGYVVGIQLNKNNITDYTPLSGILRTKVKKELADVFKQAVEAQGNNKAIENNPNYLSKYHDDVIWYNLDFKIPMIKEVTKEHTNTSITFNLIGDAETFDIMIAEQVGSSSDYGAVYSVIKTIKNVTSPYVLNKNMLHEGDYKVFFTTNKKGSKRKSNTFSFSYSH